MYVSNIPQAIQAERPRLELADMCKLNGTHNDFAFGNLVLGILDHLSRNSVFSGSFPLSSAFLGRPITSAIDIPTKINGFGGQMVDNMDPKMKRFNDQNNGSAHVF